LTYSCGKAFNVVEDRSLADVELRLKALGLDTLSNEDEDDDEDEDEDEDELTFSPLYVLHGCKTTGGHCLDNDLAQREQAEGD